MEIFADVTRKNACICVNVEFTIFQVPCRKHLCVSTTYCNSFPVIGWSGFKWNSVPAICVSQPRMGPFSPSILIMLYFKDTLRMNCDERKTLKRHPQGDEFVIILQCPVLWWQNVIISLVMSPMTLLNGPIRKPFGIQLETFKIGRSHPILLRATEVCKLFILL